MIKSFLPSFLAVLFFLNCMKEEVPVLCHLYGWVKDEADSTTGINNFVLQIKDINPYTLQSLRIREITTRTDDSTYGFFEMDSVCYGTTNQQGTGYVTIFADSIKNPGWESRYWSPRIVGDIDTIILYILR